MQASETIMTVTIYHNPRCSKSRKTLEIIRDSGVEPNVVEYLSEPPRGSRILEIARLLSVPVADLLRRGEDEFRNARDLPALDDDAALAAWLEKNPRVLQRPIVVDERRSAAVVGRPPENVHALLNP